MSQASGRRSRGIRPGRRTARFPETSAGTFILILVWAIRMTGKCFVYRNVDLHGAALPPPGCVHVNLPRIARVARDMGVDYAVALVGFEFQRGGKTLPKFEGVVVCEEFEGRLREAHAAEELRRAAEKVEKERKEAKTRWRVLFSAFWTRLSLREEFGQKGELKHGETTETMEIEGEYSYDEDADDGAERGGKRARTHGIHDEENDGGTKRMALGAAAEVEEM